MLGYRAIPAAITEAAAAAGITPSTAELAACTGLAPRTIDRIRAGGRVSKRNAEAFAAELGRTVEQLFGAERSRLGDRPPAPRQRGRR